MTRREGAGHAGAVGKKHRCHECGHRPGPRKLHGNKKSCGHECHVKKVVEIEAAGAK